MSAAAVALVVLVAIALVVGLHGGPHGLLAAGAVGAVASVGLLVGFLLAAGPGATVAVWALLAGAALISAGAFASGALSVAPLRHRPPAVEPGRLWGADGVAVTELRPLGTVRVRGETWTAESLSGAVPAGAPVHVVEVEGLRLRVWSDSGSTTGPVASLGEEGS
ncbi:MAG: NfeD family protein [Acidimicrobiales bacterium]